MFSNVRQICKRLPTCWQRQKVIMFQNTFTPNVKPSEHVYYGMTSTFARSLSVQAGAPRGSTTYKPFHGYLGDLYAADRGAEGSCQILAKFRQNFARFRLYRIRSSVIKVARPRPRRSPPLQVAHLCTLRRMQRSLRPSGFFFSLIPACLSKN